MNQMSRVLSATLVLCCASACEPEYQPPDLDMDAATVAIFGGHGSSFWFSRIIAAHKNTVGQYVLLEGTDPFIRVFTDTEAVRDFLRKGDGPGETTAPSSLTILQTGEMVVANSYNVQVFDALGHQISSSVLGGIVALAAGCDGLLVYGPGPRSSRDSVGWLRRYSTRDGSVQISPLVIYSDTMTVAYRGYGKNVLAATDNVVYLYDEYSTPPSVVSVSCDGRMLQRSFLPHHLSSRQRRDPNSLGSGDVLMFGLAATAAGPIWIERRIPDEATDDEQSVLVTIDEKGTVQTLGRIAHRLRLLSVSNDTLLFAEALPTPQLRVARLNRLLGHPE
jgi:hypothetical protein